MILDPQVSSSDKYKSHKFTCSCICWQAIKRH